MKRALITFYDRAEFLILPMGVVLLVMLVADVASTQWAGEQLFSLAVYLPFMVFSAAMLVGNMLKQREWVNNA